MSETPQLRVSEEAVKAARAEVAAFEAAGLTAQLDPMVRRIAEAKAVSVGKVMSTASGVASVSETPSASAPARAKRGRLVAKPQLMRRVSVREASEVRSNVRAVAGRKRS